MSLPEPSLWSRREWLGSLGALWAAGLWPGCLQAEPHPQRAVRFVVANDFHHESSECDAWFEGLFRQIAAHPGVKICLGLGDLAHRGRPESMAAVVQSARRAGLDFWPTPGNHDNDLEDSTAVYARTVTERLNYFEVREGWQWIMIDSTDGKKGGQSNVSEKTLRWLDETLPRLDPRHPTVLATHFPLAREMKTCPRNAEAVLERFLPFNLRGIFSGHYHASTVVPLRDFDLVTNVCCSRVAPNHDGTVQKGYFLCVADETGRLKREFVPYSGPA